MRWVKYQSVKSILKDYRQAVIIIRASKFYEANRMPTHNLYGLSKQVVAMVESSFKLLTGKEQRAIKMAYIDHLTIAKASAVLNCKPAQYSRWKHKATIKIGNYLENNPKFQSWQANMSASKMNKVKGHPLKTNTLLPLA